MRSVFWKGVWGKPSFLRRGIYFQKNFCIKHFQCFMGVLLELYVVIHREVGFLGKGYGENLLFRKEVSIFKKTFV